MMPLNRSFRRLILTYIPELTTEDLNRYDSSLALRLELSQQKSVVPLQDPAINGNNDIDVDKLASRPLGSPRERINALIALTTDEAAKIIGPHYRRFSELQRLDLARRRLALYQGGLLQVPTSKKKLVGVVSETWEVYKLQTIIFSKHVAKSIGNFFAKESTVKYRLLIISGMAILLFVAVKILM